MCPYVTYILFYFLCPDLVHMYVYVWALVCIVWVCSAYDVDVWAFLGMVWVYVCAC